MESQANPITERLPGTGGSNAGGSVRIASMEGTGGLYLLDCFNDFTRLHPG